MRLAVHTPTRRFKMRAVGAAVHAGRVLLQTTPTEPFWFLPGGTCELMESSRQTLLRELLEETGARVQVGRLLWVVENFFSYQGRQFQEMGYYYQIWLPEALLWTAGSEQFEGQEMSEDGSGLYPLTFRWFPLMELEQIELYPAFLKSGLCDLPEHIQHVVINEPPLDE